MRRRIVIAAAVLAVLAVLGALIGPPGHAQPGRQAVLVDGRQIACATALPAPDHAPQLGAFAATSSAAAEAFLAVPGLSAPTGSAWPLQLWQLDRAGRPLDVTTMHATTPMPPTAATAVTWLWLPASDLPGWLPDRLQLGQTCH